MGAACSNAVNAAADETQSELNQMMQVLRTKLDAMQAHMTAARGSEPEKVNTEVCGGRTIMRVSNITVATSENLDAEISGAIDDFFEAAQGGVEKDSEHAKKYALAGAKKVLSAGISALLGVSNGRSMEEKKFIVLFLNNAFVRCDYYVYTYSISAQKWGMEKNKAGACYVADMAVLKMSDLKPSEIDFLLSQTLSLPDGNFESVMQIKAGLMELAVLSRMLEQEDLDFNKLKECLGQLSTCRKAVASAFKTIADDDAEEDAAKEPNSVQDQGAEVTTEEEQ